jgi:hypothetical protein
VLEILNISEFDGLFGMALAEDRDLFRVISIGDLDARSVE